MTQDEFNELPLLLTRQQVMDALGFNAEKFNKLRKSGILKTWRSGVVRLSPKRGQQKKNG